MFDVGKLLRVVGSVVVGLAMATPAAAQLGTVPHVFSAHTPILSADVNENFATAYSNSLNRTGGTMTGTITSRAILPSADATYALGSGAYRYTTANFSGAVTAGSFVGPLDSASLTGTIDCARLPALTGNVTTSAGACATTIANLAVTNAMLAGSIAYSKLTLTGSVVNADIGASAAIAYSKLALTGSILNADVSGSAAIAYSKLNLATSIVNADINASAAIAWTKVSKTGSSLSDFTTVSASDLSSGTLPSARISGSYTGLTGVGTITTGVWHGTALTGSSYVTALAGSYDNTKVADTDYVAATDLVVQFMTDGSTQANGTVNAVDINAYSIHGAASAAFFVPKGATWRVGIYGGSTVTISVLSIGA